MKRFLVFLMICSSGSSFAQKDDSGWDMDMLAYQFRYSTGGKLYSFIVSGFSDMEALSNKDVYMSFVGGQKSPDLAAAFGVSTYRSDSTYVPYYCVYEYDTLGTALPVYHLYKKDGAWLYTIREHRIKTEEEEKGVANLLKMYTTGAATEEPVLYSIDRGTGDNYYMLDIRSDVLPQYESALKREYDEFALRIVTDHNFQEAEEYLLLGNSTELRELHLMSPLFLK
ncbi:MAG: hypothetical protein A3D31_06025 [Candidatus Fluviicola riflensis]|nr:MAG: hypothetical protein CHH17_08990 [Candidatus Fluviicola riflensis]OGS79520.1 MAG: hypothetical protein A3D31_06025 [Candidatus Fluviicola riflensis]OGS86951.1 MAG: hypothetical protein A2724_05485 [Fluviicola sp. RIFCSPHIGHO2_01_FULL_43_53]OGS89742.1 MAG: hypothetical protein A3E30_02230 [Fluviicola sp. RIFCSPHIGHO2_12_FULL_43_24]